MDLLFFLEVIYDLLEKSSCHLELREDPHPGIMVAGLKRIKVFQEHQLRIVIADFTTLGESHIVWPSLVMHPTLCIP